MKQKVCFDESLVLVEVQVSDKWQLIQRMVDTVAACPVIQEQPHITRSLLLDAVNEREEERSTCLGNGVAFPHARVPGLLRSVVCLALLAPPADFQAFDGKAVEVAVLILVPEDQPQTALHIMSHFARLFNDAVEYEALMGLKTAAGLYGFVSRRVLEKEESVKARDIMRGAPVAAHPNTPLKEVTRLMNQHLLDAISVTETDGRLVGEITCDQLFKHGMPDFFSQLKSIAFIREFDPFEKYFVDERQTLAQDVMSRDFAALPPNATLLEIVFELAVHHRPRVYVVNEGKLTGVIDRILVLDRVINI